MCVHIDKDTHTCIDLRKYVMFIKYIIYKLNYMNIYMYIFSKCILYVYVFIYT